MILRVWQNGSLHVAISANANRMVEWWIQMIVKFWIQPSNSSVQTRKIGKKVRGVSETHVYRNVAFGFAYAIYGISALDLAGTHS